MVFLREEAPADIAARAALLDRAFAGDGGPKPSDRVRAGRLPAAGLSLVAEDGAGRLVGSVRLWHVSAGGVPALLLGPLAVDPAAQGRGIGAMLMRRVLNRAGATGHGAVVLVGDPAYYARFGFSAGHTARLFLDPRVDARRFLGLELVPGALARAAGEVVGMGEHAGPPAPTPAPAPAVASEPAPLALAA